MENARGQCDALALGLLDVVKSRPASVADGSVTATCSSAVLEEAVSTINSPAEHLDDGALDGLRDTSFCPSNVEVGSQNKVAPSSKIGYVSEMAPCSSF